MATVRTFSQCQPEGNRPLLGDGENPPQKLTGDGGDDLYDHDCEPDRG